MRISASLVGAGRGNGATTKKSSRTTLQLFQNRIDMIWTSAQITEAHFCQKKNNCKLKLCNIVLIKNPLVVVLLQSKLGNVSQNFYTFHFM